MPDKDTNAPIRYADTNISLFELAQHYVVHCPRCQGKALINTQRQLMCTACHHTEKPGHWYGEATASVRVKCRECHQLLARTAPWKGPWKKLRMKCEHCGDVCEYEASISVTSRSHGLVTDRFFGLPLWLQTSFRDELLWAFNYEHLQLLHDYVAADLRERSPSAHRHYSVVNKLPEFIKKAKNRKAILACLNEMSKKE